MNEEFRTDVADIERAANEIRTGKFKLRLFVVGSSPKSVKAVSNIRAICEEHLCGRYELEVVDLYQQPDMAIKEQVLAAPTLVRELPEPVRRMVGDLSDQQRVIYSMNIGGI